MCACRAGSTASATTAGCCCSPTLRDHYGLTQLVAHPGEPGFEVLDRLRAESVVRIDGEVVARTADTVNPDLATGEIEVRVSGARGAVGGARSCRCRCSASRTIRRKIWLKYRYLDLRRESLHRNIDVLRLEGDRPRSGGGWRGAGFTEFQTPVLTASSLEGARDYLVPSRIHPGTFYAPFAASAAAVQAAADGGRLRPLLPDRAVASATRTPGADRLAGRGLLSSTSR